LKVQVFRVKQLTAHWKSKCGGTQASNVKRLRELEEENRHLKQTQQTWLLENRARDLPDRFQLRLA
jgi:hypothetical protein